MSTSSLARTPRPPYYAVIFTSVRTEGIAVMPKRPTGCRAGIQAAGISRVESVRDPGGLGITVSYWESTAAIAAWKAQADHLLAQQRGQREWYQEYEVRVARVERAYGRPGPAR